MRLKCQVEVLNRSVASQGMRGGCGKAAQATLFLARKPGDLVFLMYCTARDKHGTKYKVKENIQNIFGKFVSSGKATIRMKDPAVDICVKKADPDNLKRILNCIAMAHAGKELSGQSVLSSMEPAKSTHVEKPKTKLTITSKNDYPITSSFPPKLEKLKVSECRLSKIDSRMFTLKHLRVLDLSSNKIKTIPKELANMETLAELILSHNQITEFPSDLCDKTLMLSQTLRSLQLDHNSLTTLPPNFSSFQELWHLSISYNKIHSLPKDIGTLKKLKRLSASNNLLSYLPFSFINMSLEKLDLFMNPFSNAMHHHKRSNICKIVSLQEMSAKVVKTNNILYSSDSVVPYTLIRYLNNGQRCPCKSYCFESFAYIMLQFDLRQICEHLVGLDSTGLTSLPVEAILCSNKCIQKYLGSGLYV